MVGEVSLNVLGDVRSVYCNFLPLREYCVFVSCKAFLLEIFLSRFKRVYSGADIG